MKDPVEVVAEALSTARRRTDRVTRITPEQRQMARVAVEALGIKYHDTVILATRTIPLFMLRGLEDTPQEPPRKARGL